MKNKSFVISAIILALGGFFAKAIGALYKIPLTNILGSSGMGLYYLIFPVYSLIITFCSSGLNVALATEVAKCRKIRHRFNEQKLLRVALILSFVISLFFTIIILIVCKPLAFLQGNINAYWGYIAIAPAIIISSIISTLRGYFQGVENMIPTTVSMIIEQIIKLTSGLMLAHKLCVYGIQYAVLGAVIGVTLSEVVALIIISINFFTFKGQLYYNYKNKFYKGKRKINVTLLIKSLKFVKSVKYSKSKNMTFLCTPEGFRYSNIIALKKILKVLMPATFSSIVLPIITMLDSFLIINLLIDSGYSTIVSTSLYGLWGGVVQSLISLPIIVITGISTSMVPSLSGVVAGCDNGNINRKVMTFIKISLLLSVLLFAIIFVFAEDIIFFLYGDGLNTDVIDELSYTTKMLKMSSISIIYYAFLQTFTAIFQTMGKAYIPFIALIISFVLRFILSYYLVLVPYINIFGVIIAHTLFLGLTTIILALFLRKKIELGFKFLPQLLMPIIMGFLIILFMYMCHVGLSQIINYFWSMIISSILGALIFLFWAIFGKVFNEKEKWEMFKKYKRWSKKVNKKN